MRKDSRLFLEKLLEYREKKKADSFKLHIDHFAEIPNIDTEIDVILEELKDKNCISQKSECMGSVIQIYLTLDGIMYLGEIAEEKSNPSIVFNVEGGQVNVTSGSGKIEATQSNREEKSRIIIIKEHSKTNTSSTNASSDSENGVLILAIIGGMLLTKCYLDYKFEVQMGLMLVAMMIEMITLFTYCKGKKTGIVYGENIKKISLFNMSSITIVPIIILIINSPIYKSKVRLDLFIEEIENAGIAVAFFQSEYAYYALCQMLGMIVLAAFLICIVVSDIYIISIINIVEKRKGKWLWNSLLKLTYRGNDSWKRHMISGAIFMVISILFAGGIFPFVINWITKMNIST